MRIATLTVAAIVIALGASSASALRRGDSSFDRSSAERGTSMRGTKEHSSNGFNIKRDGPRLERGEMVNTGPRAVERQQGPVERAVRESPVTPYYSEDRGVGAGFRRSF